MDAKELMTLILPHIMERAAPVIGGQRLVHYTSADAAYRIISGKQIWLRTAHLMNDYSEMAHGLACLQSAWGSPAGETLRKWLNQHWNGLEEDLLSAFDQNIDSITHGTFLLSLSEHNDHEDRLGRLSMWRAYGAPTGVALVLNPRAFVSATDAMKVYSAPVIYRDIPSFVEWFEQWVQQLLRAHEPLKLVARDQLLNALFYALRTFVLGTKHPGFQEEKEWRVFHNLALDGTSPWLSYEVEVIGGAPQHVVKLKLFDDLEANVEGVDPALLVDRVIIGPCENPLPIRHALAFALGGAGMQDPLSRIWMSYIPLRQK